MDNNHLSNDFEKPLAYRRGIEMLLLGTGKSSTEK